MKTINIESSDSVIWDRDQVILDIFITAWSGEPFVINLNFEGPCAESLGLYSVLDDVCSKVKLDKKQITIRTCNLIESHPEYVIERVAPGKGILGLQAKLKDNPAPYKIINSNTKHFGNFVGHGNRIRLAIAAWLHANHKSKTLQSYHTDIQNPYFREFIGLEDLMFYGYDNEVVDHAYDLLKSAPIKLDKIVTYPILHDEKVYDIIDYYPNIFVDIVNQTYFTGKTFYVDDKFWRSVITKTPFMIQGPANFISNLKKLGFQTFGQWWDEGYSEDPPDYQVKHILENINRLSALNIEQLKLMYEEMKPVLDHNYNLFMELEIDSILTKF